MLWALAASAAARPFLAHERALTPAVDEKAAASTKAADALLGALDSLAEMLAKGEDGQRLAHDRSGQITPAPVFMQFDEPSHFHSWLDAVAGLRSDLTEEERPRLVAGLQAWLQGKKDATPGSGTILFDARPIPSEQQPFFTAQLTYFLLCESLHVFVDVGGTGAKVDLFEGGFGRHFPASPIAPDDRVTHAAFTFGGGGLSHSQLVVRTASGAHFFADLISRAEPVDEEDEEDAARFGVLYDAMEASGVRKMPPFSHQDDGLTARYLRATRDPPPSTLFRFKAAQKPRGAKWHSVPQAMQHSAFEAFRHVALRRWFAATGDAAASFKMYVCLAMSKELMIALLGPAAGAAAADAAIKAQLGALRGRAGRARMASKLPMTKAMRLKIDAMVQQAADVHGVDELKEMLDRGARHLAAAGVRGLV